MHTHIHTHRQTHSQAHFASVAAIIIVIVTIIILKVNPLDEILAQPLASYVTLLSVSSYVTWVNDYNLGERGHQMELWVWPSLASLLFLNRAGFGFTLPSAENACPPDNYMVHDLTSIPQLKTHLPVPLTPSFSMSLPACISSLAFIMTGTGDNIPRACLFSGSPVQRLPHRCRSLSCPLLYPQALALCLAYNNTPNTYLLNCAELKVQDTSETGDCFKIKIYLKNIFKRLALGRPTRNQNSALSLLP